MSQIRKANPMNSFACTPEQVTSCFEGGSYNLCMVSVPFSKGTAELGGQSFPITFKPSSVYCHLIGEKQITTPTTIDTEKFFGFGPTDTPASESQRKTVSANIQLTYNDFPIQNDFNYGYSIPNSTSNPFTTESVNPDYYGIFQQKIQYMYRFSEAENDFATVRAELEKLGMVEGKSYSTYTDTKNVTYMFYLVEVHKNAVMLIPASKAWNAGITFDFVQNSFCGSNKSRQKVVLRLADCDPK
ncbi:hypothetical protein DFA_07551 [Cavenderia fasciculata]|uniref:Monalysin Pore-forming domain-containing protein n=1 Tax=Cavenderia fasciculata TaxID=261658 RepID=F4PWR3_CACFS|nr:uncharacterized protein DFA_07551 [Cavenderia fasciculata]EGG20427.1 hypothetical protein DFA_07551 [Cavenderia fasciculata]|eukprot:XP_004367410.1 hypothetical protein DFA_07551 [Cavenderia fasciculata]